MHLKEFLVSNKASNLSQWCDVQIYVYFVDGKKLLKIYC